RPPSREEVLQLTLRLIDEVGKLRAAGATHRDLHPANLIIDTKGGVHLIDFGWVLAAGLAELSPGGLGAHVPMPATRTTIDVRPPESSGDDLFAVGRIAEWMNGTRDPDVDFLAAWLGHPDSRLRLSEVDLARALVLRLLRNPGSEACRSSDSENLDQRFEQALLQLSRRALGKMAHIEEAYANLKREHERSTADSQRSMRELAEAQSRERNLALAVGSEKEARESLALKLAAAERRIEEAKAHDEGMGRDLTNATRALGEAERKLEETRTSHDAEVAQLAADLRRRETELANVQQRWFLFPSAPSQWARGRMENATHKLAGTFPVRVLKAVRNAARRIRPGPTASPLRQQIIDSAIFEADWYLQTYPEVSQAGREALDHYLEHGGREARDPGPLFDAGYYLYSHPDVRASGINPLLHYLDHGAAEGRDPNPFFDTSYYLEQNPDVAQAGMNPLTHFITHGAAEGRRPSPLFDPSYYLRTYPDVAASGMNPLAHYLRLGIREGRFPNAESDPTNTEQRVLSMPATHGRPTANAR
ncbi:MAG TPA: hypothetical protein VMK12_09495, partial [Anaeromyxobacteraceae bacterium]|nr:hypothetical protein [Anaeromyxobacteraceae bacterium]